ALATYSAAPTATGANKGIGILTSPVYLIFCNNRNTIVSIFINSGNNLTAMICHITQQNNRL
ncbi:hypothetical protein, partial [Photorhabdus aegyptia]|uniref:hypothetical protein n=1 Tax=Photorhabdus aegyptia TaxID=2805098 RepID=UPI001F37C5FF